MRGTASHGPLLAVLAIVFGLLVGCAKKPPHAPLPPPVPPPPPSEVPSLAPAPWSELGDFRDDMGCEGLEAACLGSAGYYRKVRPDAEFRFGDQVRTAAEMATALDGLLASLREARGRPSQVRKYLAENFDLLRSTGSDGEGAVLFTGYYEPWLQARRAPDARFRYPLYARPDDLLTVDLSLFPLAKSSARIAGRLVGSKVVPYHTREEIVSGAALSGKGLELLWLEDPVDLFFLQIQGSGRATLEDGSQVRVQYDAGNGHPYKSLGRLMIDLGKLEEGKASMQDIRAYLAEHPGEADALLNLNPSYTFFRLENQGPFGNISVALTPGRSIATDAALFPKGAPCIIATETPRFGDDGAVAGYEPMARLVFNQDTGGAIRGPGRVDLFFGGGPEAGRSAGVMKRDGSLYFLVPKVGVRTGTAPE